MRRDDKKQSGGPYLIGDHDNDNHYIDNVRAYFTDT